MTAEEWDDCVRPRQMLRCLHREAQGQEWRSPENRFRHELVPRRWRLIVAAFIRRLPPRRGPYLTTAERLERLADAAPESVDWRGEWREHYRFGWERYHDYWMTGALRADFAVPGAGAIRVVISRHWAAEFRGVKREVMRWHLLVEEERAQAHLIRCVFGNPFRLVACDPSWRTSTVVGLAEAIYAERAFDRLPILADALEDAGCTHPDVLAHCRGDGPHARGCWVVDLILGKT